MFLHSNIFEINSAIIPYIPHNNIVLKTIEMINFLNGKFIICLSILNLTNKLIKDTITNEIGARNGG